MKLFEYNCVRIWDWSEATTRRLNEYGREGWELVAVYSGWYYFKRELKNKEKQ
ncbi:MAG: hypothetical protein ACOYEH_01155 [Caldicoprobacterales bacterium]|nr:hypothetical protein [Clostridiales bacterium]